MVNYTVEELENFELECKKEWESGQVLRPVHLSKGNEKELIEIFQYVHPEDYVFSTWRNHYQTRTFTWYSKRLVDGRSQKR